MPDPFSQDLPSPRTSLALPPIRGSDKNYNRYEWNNSRVSIVGYPSVNQLQSGRNALEVRVTILFAGGLWCDPATNRNIHPPVIKKPYPRSQLREFSVKFPVSSRVIPEVKGIKNQKDIQYFAARIKTKGSREYQLVVKRALIIARSRAIQYMLRGASICEFNTREALLLD